VLVFACAEEAPRDPSAAVLLKVGSTAVTVSDFEAAVRLRGGAGMVPDDESGDFERYRDVVVRALTTEALLREEARLRGMHVDDHLVDAEMKASRERFPEDFDVFVRERFGGAERYRQLLAQRALAETSERAIRRELAEDSLPTDDDVLAYFEAHREAFATPARVKVRQLAVPERELAEDLRSRLLAGADFESLATEARQHGGEGGDMGWYDKGSMPPWFEETAWNHKGGQVSRPVDADGLQRILQVMEVQREQEPELDSVREAIARQLQLERIDERFAAWVDQRLEELRLHTDRQLLAALHCCRGGLPYVQEEKP
jgi:hypothetical protein